MPTAAADDKKKQPEVKYFRSLNDGLAVQVGDNNPEGSYDPDLLVHVRFTRYTEKFQGDTIRVGYLATDNARAIEVLSNDPYVSELSKEDYDKAVEAATLVG